MVYYSFYNETPANLGFQTMDEGLRQLFKEQWIKDEIKEVLNVRLNDIHFLEKPHDFNYDNPLYVHAHYTTEQIMAAFSYFNEERRPAFREGVKHFQDKKTDIFFITLNKSEKDFSPSTLYDDYAINEKLFHWQSQSRVSDSSPTAKRYITHKDNNHKIALFIREYRQKDGFTAPFMFAGTADYVSHEGSSPVSFVWRLHEPLPASLVTEAGKAIL